MESNNSLLDIQLRCMKNISKESIIDFLVSLSNDVGANMIMYPFVAHFPYNYKEVEEFLEIQERSRRYKLEVAKRMKEILVSRHHNSSGYSGLCMYDFGYCSVHVWPNTKYMSLDITYRYELNNDLIIENLKKSFAIESVSGLYIIRKEDKQMIKNIFQ